MKRSIVVLVLALAVLMGAAPAPRRPLPLTILHTNDTHGHLLPFSYPEIAVPGTAFLLLKDKRDIGGIARRATLVSRIRQSLMPRGVPVWLVDGGDFTDGTPFSIEYHGEADIAAMNAVPYTLGTLGNHELNTRLAQTRKLIALARYPIVCANARDTATGTLLTKAYVVQQVGPIKIGVFGLLTREAANYPAAKEGVTIEDEIETARAMVKTLRPLVQIVVLVSHAGEVVDEKIAARVPGIDVIVGGHSHTRLAEGAFVWKSDDLKADDVNGTVVVQAYQWGGELGRLDLLFARDTAGAWHVERYRARLIPVTASLPDDVRVARVVDRFWSPIAARYGEVVGQAAADFSTRGDDAAQYSLVTDAICEAFHTDVELENMHSVRSPIVRGAITLGDLIALDPFGNTVVLFRISGKALRELLRRHTPEASGIRFRVENGTLLEATVAGQPIDDDRIYTAATNSYFASSALNEVEKSDTGKTRLEVVIDYIRSKGTVRPVYDGRRVVLPGDGER